MVVVIGGRVRCWFFFLGYPTTHHKHNNQQQHPSSTPYIQIPYENTFKFLVKSPSGNISFWESSYQPKWTFRIGVSPRIGLLFLGNQLHFRVPNCLLREENDYIDHIHRILPFCPSLYLLLSLWNPLCSRCPRQSPFMESSAETVIELL